MHILSPVSASWCGWMMFLLLLCAVLAEMAQPGIIKQAYTSLEVHKERAYKESPDTFLGQLFISLFRVGTASMALCLCFCAENRFTLTAFGIVTGLVMAVVLTKMVCNVVLDYTFALSRRFGTAYEHYGNIATLASLVLYPVVLTMIRIGSVQATYWSVGIVAGLFALVWLYRTLRMYTVSLMAGVYVLMYFCTMELLPMAGLAYVSAKTLTNI